MVLNLTRYVFGYLSHIISSGDGSDSENILLYCLQLIYHYIQEKWSKHFVQVGLAL
jgi:hypothetical protein